MRDPSPSRRPPDPLWLWLRPRDGGGGRGDLAEVGDAGFNQLNVFDYPWSCADGEDELIEATYLFPLLHETAVDQMRITVGGRVIEGEIHERTEAQRIYEEAREAGQVAALTEEQRPNIFTQRVANIGPGETITVTLGVIEPVPRTDGAYELVFPLMVAPRFIPGSIADGAAITVAEPAPGEQPPSVPVGIDVDVHAAIPIVRAESPTNQLDLAIDGEGLGASVYGVPSTKNFVLRWWTAGA